MLTLPLLSARCAAPLTRLLLIGLLGLGAGCGGEGGEAQAGGSGRPGAPGGWGEGQPRRPPAPVAVASAMRGSIASRYGATATLGAEKEAEVLARVGGVVQSIDREEGDLVEEGNALLRIDNDEYRLRLAQAEAKTASLSSRYQRMQDMIAKQLVSTEEYETVKNDLKLAEAEEGLARLDLSYTRVRAPFTGAVVERLVDVGQNVSAGTPLFRLADFDPLLAEVHVPSKEFRKLQVDQPVQLVLDSNAVQLSGRIKLVSPIIDPTSGTIKVTIEIDEYPPETRPGDFAQVRIVTEQRRDRVLVPRVALVTDRGEEIVYVAAADSTAERRVVATGFEDEEHFEIVDGLEEGELVVIKGQRSLKHGQPIKVMDDPLALDEPPPTEESTEQPGRPGGRRRAGS